LVRIFRKVTAKIGSLLRRVCLTFIPSDCNKSALTGEICLKIKFGDFLQKFFMPFGYE